MMFVDEVKARMPQHSVLDQIKEDIMTAARYGCHTYMISRTSQDMDLTEEIKWLKDEGFKVIEYEPNENYYYDSIWISWG